jgi:hypothetical protein
MPRRSHSGQMMLIMGFLVLIIMLTIPPLIFRHMQTGKSGNQAQQLLEAGALGEEGIVYAMNALSDATVWQNALAGQFPTVCSSTFDGTKGYQFRIQCSVGEADMTGYQVKIKSTALARLTHAPTRTLQALVSHKTMGTTLRTKVSGAAALELLQTPVVNGALIVHWGPIVLMDTNTWTLNGAMDQYRFPRKFSQGGIAGSYSESNVIVYPRSPTFTPPTSDNSEYWAFSQLGVVPPIDEAVYQTSATLSQVVLPGSASATPFGTGNLSTVPTTSSATFDSVAGYVSAASTNVYFVNGNARFGRLALDLKNRGGVVVTGNLELADNTSGGSALGLAGSLRVPPYALIEYPYDTTRAPCIDSQHVPPAGGGSCSSTQAIATSGKFQYRGFLYVKGDLIVKTGTNWVLVGAVRVDGRLIVEPNATLTLYYDDLINHSIQTQSSELQIDNIRDISAS